MYHLSEKWQNVFVDEAKFGQCIDSLVYFDTADFKLRYGDLLAVICCNRVNYLVAQVTRYPCNRDAKLVYPKA